MRRYTRAAGPFPAACLRGHFPAVLRRRVFSPRRALSVHGCGGYFSRSRHLFSFPMPVYPLKNKNELCPNQKGSTSAGIGENGPHRADTCTDCSINRPALQWVRTGFRPLWAKRDAERRFFDGERGALRAVQSQTALRPTLRPAVFSLRAGENPFSSSSRRSGKSPRKPCCLNGKTASHAKLDETWQTAAKAKKMACRVEILHLLAIQTGPVIL